MGHILLRDLSRQEKADDLVPAYRIKMDQNHSRLRFSRNSSPRPTVAQSPNQLHESYEEFLERSGVGGDGFEAGVGQGLPTG